MQKHQDHAPPKRRSIMARLGMERPSHFNGLIGWFELLAGAWVSYGFFWGCVAAWNHKSIALLGFPLLTALILYTLILLTTRRASVIAYWALLALLMGPATKLAHKLPPAPLETLAAQPLEVWISLVFSLGAAILLLHPRNRLWLALLQLERKRAQAPRETTQPYHLYDSITGDGTLYSMALFSTPEYVLFDELCAVLPEQGSRQWNSGHTLIVEDEDTVPLVMALRKTAKLHALPKGDLNTVLRESAEAALKPKRPPLNEICQFLVQNGISWKLSARNIY